MRFTSVAVLSALLAASPAFAQSSGKPVFGSYTCAQQVPCEKYGGWEPSQWAQAGNACVTRGFGFSSSNGFIDEYAGLDASNCLTAKPKSLDKGAGAQLSPRCCVVTVQSSNCVIHCDLVQE